MQSVLEVALSNALVAAVLGGLVYALGRFFQRPALIHCLWIVVLLKLITPPLVSIPINLPMAKVPGEVSVHLSLDAPLGENASLQDSPNLNTPPVASNESAADIADPISSQAAASQAQLPAQFAASSTSAAAADSPEAGRAPARSISLLVGLAAVWILGAGVFLLRSISRIWRFRRLLKFATAASSETQARIEQLALGMGIKRIPQAYILPGNVSPMLWAFRRRACLLLPGQLMDELSEDAQETVIVHELAHYRRLDHWVRGLELIVTSLFWWHPVVWLAVREIRQVEEECCDAWVVTQLPEHRSVYARTLVQTIAFISARPATMPAVAGVLGKGFYQSVEQRVRSIMSKSPTSGVSMSPLMRLSLVVFALVVLPLVPVTGDEAEDAQAPAAQAGNLQPPADEPTSFGGSSAELGSVSNVAVSPGGRILVAGHGLAGGPGALSVWDLEKSQMIRSFPELRGVTSLSISPDGKLAAYGTRGNLVRVRRMDSLAVVQELTGYEFQPVHVALSADGRMAVAQKEIQIFDTQTWQQTPVQLEEDPLFSKETFFIHGVHFSPDGSQLLACGGNYATGEAYGRTVVWDMKTGKLICSTPYAARLYAAYFSPDGKSFATAATDGRIQVCDAQTGQVSRLLAFERNPNYDMAWSPDGKQILAVGAIRGFAVFDVETSQMLNHFGQPDDRKIRSNSGVFTPDGSKIVTGNSAKVIGVWNAKTAEPIIQFPSSSVTQTSQQPVLAVGCSPDGRWIASGREDTTVTIHNARSGEVVKVLKGHQDAVSTVAFSSTGMLASGGYDETIKLWDVKSGAEVRTLQGHDNWVFGLAFSPDGSILASCGYDKTIRLWDVASGKRTALVEGHTAGVRAVAFSPDGKLLASASSDRSVKVWDVATRAEVATLQGHEGAVRSVAFSPDREMLATAAEDNSAKLWSTSDWKELHTLGGHQGMVWSVAFSAGGKNLATGSFDRSIKVWNPASGKLRQTLDGHRDVVASVAFAPDTSALVSGGLDRTLRIWRAAGAATAAKTEE